MRKWYTVPNLNVDRDSLFVMVMCYGGINYHKEYLKGELRHISECGRGRFCVNKDDTGQTLDHLTRTAIDYGYLSDDATLSDFVEYLVDDVSNRKRRYSIFRNAAA